MYQQQVPQPHEGRGWNGSESAFEAGLAGNPLQNDQLADAIARRLQAQPPSMIPISSGVRWTKSPLVISSGQRLALAVISVIALIPLAGIVLGVLGAAGLIELAVMGTVILGINFLFQKDHL